MRVSVPAPTGQWRLARFLLPAYVAVLAIMYLLQAQSPLRLNTDAYRLLAMAVSAYEGKGFLVEGQVEQFPVGYPLVVSTLLRAGLATSVTLILLNLLCLAIGLWVLYEWSRRRDGPYAAALPMAFVLSAWVMIKHVTLPLTELVYFGVSWSCLLALWLFGRAKGPRKWAWFALATALACAALLVRSVALALVPVLALAALLHRDNARFLRRCARDRKYALACASAAVAILLVVVALALETGWVQSQFLYVGSYFQSLVTSVGGTGVWHGLVQNALYRLLELGEVFANLPRGRLPGSQPVFYLAGLLAAAALARGTWLLARRHDSLPMLVYFLAYCALMLAWPYYDPRFWLPLLPVMAVLLLQTLDDLQRRWPVVRYASACYLACFFLLGLAALVFSTRISLSGSEFSELYGDGSTTMTYRYAFQNGKPVDASRVSEDQVRILRIFEPLARSRAVPEKGQPGLDWPLPQARFPTSRSLTADTARALLLAPGNR